MPEGMNVAVAHKLSEQTSASRHKRRWEEVFEILRGAGLGRRRHRNGMDRLPGRQGDGALTVLYGQATRDLLGAAAAIWAVSS